MLFNLKNPFEVQKFDDYCKKLKKQESIVEIKKKYPLRSLAQNKYFHVILTYWASVYGCNLDEAKVRFFKEVVNPDIFWSEYTNKRGIKVKRLRSSSELTTTEMTLAIERFRNWSQCNEELPLYLPAPHEDEALVYALQEIERNKEFIQMPLVAQE